MDIASSIKKYKNSVTRKYISLSNDEIDVVTKGDYWFSRKYDGQLWFYCKSNKNSKIIIPKHADIKNITPTAKVSDITVSFLQYFLIKTILQAKKKPAMIGSNCKIIKCSDHGSKIKNAPKHPKIKAEILQNLIVSFKTITAKIDTNIG